MKNSHLLSGQKYTMAKKMLTAINELKIISDITETTQDTTRSHNNNAKNLPVFWSAGQIFSLDEALDSLLDKYWGR